LSEVAKQVESLIKHGHLHQVEAWLVVLRTEYTQLMDELVFFEQKISAIE